MYQHQPGYVQYPPPPAPRGRTFGWKSALFVLVMSLLLAVVSFFLGVKFAPALGNAPLVGNGSIDGYYLYTDSTTVELLHLVSVKQTILGSSYNLQIDEHGESVRTLGNSSICDGLSANTYVANIAGSVFTWGSLTGTFNGNTITFTLPSSNGNLQDEVFTRASVDQYNTALQQLRNTYQGASGC